MVTITLYARQLKLYRTVFWTLWEREKVGWFGRMALKCVISYKKSALILKIPFLLLNLEFFISSFSSCFRCRVRLFIWLFSVSWGMPVLPWTFPLGLLLPCPTGFGLLCFHFHSFLKNFDFFFDFFCDLLVIQQRVVQPPYVGIFHSFSPVIEI